MTLCSSSSNQPAARAARARRVATVRLVTLVTAVLLIAAAASAQLPLQPVGSPFDVTGFIQKATLDAPGDVMAGGTLQVNGMTIIVPRNTVMQMPAFALTWQQLFAMAPPPYTGTQTGLAMLDTPTPLTTYEIHVQGNRVNDQYIAGLIFMSQNLLNSGQGFINYIDYANAELHVGGKINDPTTGTRVKLNDPLGRFAQKYTLDPRFTIDEDNPTVRSQTGYPMCLPRIAPTASIDGLCPQWNRPIDPTSGNFQTIFTMPPPGGPSGTPDPMLAAPFEIGDYVTFAGTLMKDGPQPSAGPMPANGTAGTYIAAHTILANIGIFTAPGMNPAYVAIDVGILGVGGIPLQGIPQEATARTRFEGFTTDISRVIFLSGMDLDGCSGSLWDRDWGMIDVDPGPPLRAVKGRWRFRPPTKVILGPSAGVFLPPTRNVRAALSGAWDPWDPPVMSSNGLVTGQYNAPIFQFLFPENLGVGTPPVPLNFQDFPFLVNGTFNFTNGVNAGQLTPWPGATTPVSACGAPYLVGPPTAVVGPDQNVVAGTQVTLDGSASSDPTGLAIGWTWTQTVGPTVTLNSTFVAKPTFTAPPIPAGLTGYTATFQLIVTNTNGLDSLPAFVNVNVTPQGAVVQPPAANAGAPQIVPAGSVVQLNAGASIDPNIPARTPLTYAWIQTGLGGLPPVTLTNGTTATPTFTAPVPSAAAATLTFQVTVTNTAGLSSTSITTVTVNPVVAPIANAGPNQIVLIGTAVNLTAGASTDPNGLPLTYTWAQTLGTAVTLSGGNSAGPSYTAPGAATVQQFTVTVSNGYLTSTATVTVTVVAQPDQIRITVASYSTQQQRLTVTATSSTAGGAAILSLVGYGPNGSDVVMPFIGGPANNTYTIILSAVPIPSMWTVTVNSNLGGTTTSALTKIK